MKYSKKAFTMTEVVIVITLIGVLALILVPTIKNMLPDEDNIKYKKAFTTIQETINLMMNDPNVCQRYNANSGTTVTNQLQFCNTVTDADPDSSDLYVYTPRNLYKEICLRLNTASEVDCDNYTAGADHCQTISTPTGLLFAIPPIDLDTNFQDPVAIRVNLYGNAVACNNNAADGKYSILIDRTGRVYAETGSVEQELLLNDPQD